MTSWLSRYGEIVFGVLLVLALASLSVRSQTEEENYKPILVDEFASVGECDFRARLDSLLTELSRKPDFHGYVINYKGTNELPDSRDSNPRETDIANHIAFRNFDSSRITILRGGYRAEITTELWIVAPGVNPPAPSKTLPAPIIAERSTFLFAKNYLASDENSLLEDYVLPTVKEREAAELEEMNRQSEAEQAAETPDVPQAPAEPTNEAAAQSDNAEPYVDDRTEEEKHAEKFAWADVGLAKFIAGKKGSSGVVMFYADDERYDIKKMRHLLEEGRDRLASNATIKPNRLKIVFGGYRRSAEVEFWFVPSKGKNPRPKPEERPVPEREDAGETNGPPN